ncbi:hypothetical protein [Candidatus Tisiphia endosymbiont of Beris chalybata]|uniref:hypothetical protein n=1 Tax=Candidatus Tisiphia endosymbiont of Beris chalybata TaxID=3066262 RepID=UPI00312CACAD
MPNSEERYAPLFAEFYGLIGERIDSIKESWKYQYPELKGIFTNIQAAISTYQGSEKLDIFLPENIQGRDKTLKEDLIKDLQYISKGYKHIYEQAQTKNKEEQQEFQQERDNYFTKELLEDIERQQESMEKLFKLFQDNKQEYNKQLQVLIDEDFEKQKPIEILAKILSTLPEDSEEYKKQLHNFVDIAFKLQETERKLYQLPMDIKKYEQQLETFEGTESQLQETQLKLEQLSEEYKKLSQDFVKLKHEQINVVQQEGSGKRQLQREYEYGMKFLFNSQLQNEAIQMQHNTQNFSLYKWNFFIKQRDELAKNYITWLEKIEKQTTRIVSATPKKNKSYVESRKLVRKEIVWANEIGLVDPEMLAIFEEYNDRPQEQNMKKLFNIARARYPYPNNI